MGALGSRDETMEAAVVYWGYVGRMENKMETAIAYIGVI